MHHPHPLASLPSYGFHALAVIVLPAPAPAAAAAAAAVSGPRTSSPALPCRVGDSPVRFATSGNSGVVTTGAESQAQSGPRVRYGESGGGLRQPQLQHSPPPRLGALD